MSTHIIAIAGPSCSGKTYLANFLADRLSAAILPIDAYYRDLASLPFESRCKFNFDTPESIDHDLLRDNIAGLAAGVSVQRPVYDFTVHCRSAMRQTVHPGHHLILEGLFALYWDDIRPLLATKVYVDAPDDVCLARRKIRDVRERGRTVESVDRQYMDTVRPMAEIYVYPTRRFADVVVSGQAPVEQSCAAVLAHIDTARPAAARAPHAR